MIATGSSPVRACTGLRDHEAHEAGLDPVTFGSVEFDHKAYYPGAHQLHLRITGDRTSGRLLGAQLLGDQRAQVAKRIDIPAGALFHHMRRPRPQPQPQQPAKQAQQQADGASVTLTLWPDRGFSWLRRPRALGPPTPHGSTHSCHAAGRNPGSPT
jgi:hypothetical protein